MKKMLKFKMSDGANANVIINFNDGCLSIMGEIYYHGRCNECGQCLDTINTYVEDPLFKEIYDLWKKWNLNDMHAGTKEQEDYLTSKGIGNNYEEACQALKDANIYRVMYHGKYYEYGHSWIKYEIPEEDVARINNILHD